MDKKSLRNIVNDLLVTVTADDIRDRSRRLAGHLTASALWREAGAVFGYMSFKKEILTRPLLDAALAGGKAVALPRVEGTRIRFYLVDGFEDLRANRWGIWEPTGTEPPADPAGWSRVLVLTPGVAFAPDGRRLGRGGGFYDGFLSGVGPSVLSVGLALEEQIREDIPTDERDIRVDALCTADGWRRPPPDESPTPSGYPGP